MADVADWQAGRAGNAPGSPLATGTDRKPVRIWFMGTRKRTPTEIFSWTSLAVSLAMLSGLALGHATEQSMHPRLSASLPADPVERFGLGQNAYDTRNASLSVPPAQPADYADASYEIGQYRNGARILIPAEPARKIERLRLERLQAWNDETFGADGGLDEHGGGYAETASDDYAPIDVGAVIDAPESQTAHAVRYAGTSDSGV